MRKSISKQNRIGFAFRSIAFITALTVFLQGPLAIAATNIWSGKGDSQSLLKSENWDTLDITASDTLKFVPRGSAGKNISSFEKLSLVLGSQSTVFGISIGDARLDGASEIALSGAALSLGSALTGDGIVFTDVGPSARSLTISNALILKSSMAVNVNTSTDSVVLSGSVSTASGAVSGSLSKLGNGALILSGDNSGLLGGIDLAAGVLGLNHAKAAGIGTLRITGGALDNTSGGPVSLATNNVQDWRESFTYVGSGGSTLNMGTGGATLGTNITVQVSAGTLGVGGNIEGAYALTKSGAGVLALSGENVFTEGLTLAAGGLWLNSAGALGSGSLNILGGFIDNTSGNAVTLYNGNQHVWAGDFTFLGSGLLDTGYGDVTLTGNRTVTVSAGTLSVSGIIGGTYGLVKDGAGVLSLSASNTFDGGLTVKAGSVTTTADEVLVDAAGVTVRAGGTLNLGGYETVATVSGEGNVVIGAGKTFNVAGGSVSTLSGQIIGDGNLDLQGNSRLILSGSNTYTGVTYVSDSNGVLTIGAGGTTGSLASNVVLVGTLAFNRSDSLTYAGQLSSDSGEGLVAINGGTINLSGDNSSFNGSASVNAGRLVLSGIFDNNVAAAAGTTVELAQSGVSTYYGIVSGSGSLMSSGTGEVTLLQAQDYLGSTTVTAGTLIAGMLQKSSALVVSGGSLIVGGLGAILPTAKVNGSGVLQIDVQGLAFDTVSNSSTAAKGVYFTAASGVTNIASLSGTGSTYVVSDLTLGGTLSEGALTVAGNLNANDITSSAVVTAETLTTVGTVSGGQVTVGANGGGAQLATVSGGSLTLLGAANSVETLNGGEFSLSAGALSVNGGNQTSGSISGVSAALQVNVNQGVFSLNRENSYGAGTYLQAGTLGIGHNGALGTGSLFASAGTSFDAVSGARSIANNIAISDNSGVVSFLGSNNLTTSGSIYLPGDGALNVSGSLVVNGGLDGSTGINSFNKEGSGVLVLGGAANNMSGGNINVNGGTLQVGHIGALDSSLVRVSDGATVDLNGFNVKAPTNGIAISGSYSSSVGALSNSSSSTAAYAGDLSLESAAAAIGGTGDIVLSGVLSDNGSAFGLLKVGAGSLTLAGVSTYTGMTTVAGGAFIVAGSLADGVDLTLTGGKTSFNNGASLGTVLNDATLSFLSSASLQSLGGSGGTTFGGSASIVGLSSTGTTVFNGTADVSGGVSAGVVIANGNFTTLELSGGSLTLAGSVSSLGAVSGGVLTVAAGAADIANGVSGGSMTVGSGAVVDLSNFDNAWANNQGSLQMVALNGGTVTNSGSLTVGSLGDGFVTNNATLNVGGGVFVGTLASTLSTSTLYTNGTVALNGTLSAYKGGFVVDGGNLSIGASSPLGGGNAVTILNGGQVSFDSVFSLNIGSLGAVANEGNLSFNATDGTVGIASLSGTGVTQFASNLNVGIYSSGIISSIGIGSGTLSIDSISGTTLNTSASTVVSSLVDGSIVLSNSAALLLSSGSDAVISGDGTLTKVGSGSLVLKGLNDFTGLTTVTDGVLHVNGSLQDYADLTISGGTARFVNQALLNEVANDGLLEFLASGTLTNLSGSGFTKFIDAGTIQTLSSTGKTEFSSTAYIDSGVSAGIVTVAGSAVIKGEISGGAVTLNGSHNYLSSLSAGTLLLNAGSTSFSGFLWGGNLTVSKDVLAEAPGLAGGDIIANGTLRINTGASSDFRGSLNGSGSLAFSQTEQLLSGTVSGFSGTYHSLDGSSLAINTLTSSRASVVIDGSSSVWLMTSGGSIGAVSVSNGGSLLLGAGYYNYASGYIVNSNLPTGGTFSLGSLSGDGVVANVVQAPVTLNVGADNTSTVFSGSLTQDQSNSASPLSLVKVGTGRLALTGENSSLAGSVAVNDGTLSIGNGSTTGSLARNVAVASGATVEFNRSNALTYASEVSGAGSLLKDGAGELTLSGGNTFTGGTVVKAGTVTVTGSLVSNADVTTTAQGTAKLNYQSPVVRTLTNDGATYFGATSGAASVGTLLGNGVTTFGAALNVTNYEGAGTVTSSGSGALSFTTVNGTSLALSGDASIGTLRAGAINLTSNGTLTVSGGSQSGAISGLASLVKVSPSTLVLNGANTFSRGTSVKAGTLVVSAVGSLKSGGDLSVDSGATVAFKNSQVLGTVNSKGALSLVGDSSIVSVESTGSLTHTGTLTVLGAGTITSLLGDASTKFVKNGTGTLTLRSTYAGSTLVGGGKLSLDAGVNLLGNVTVDGGYLQLLGGSHTFGGNLTLSSGIIDLGVSKLVAGNFSATGGELTGTGELTANSLSISGGTMNAATLLKDGSATQSFNSGRVTLKTIGTEANLVPMVSLDAIAPSGTLGVSVTTETVFAGTLSLKGSGNSLVVNGGSSTATPYTKVLVIGGTGNSITFTNGFKYATPDLVLTVGDATSKGGSLIVGGAGLSLSATQTLKGVGTVVGNVLLGSGAVLAPGNSPGVLTILNGNAGFGSGSTLEIQFDGTAAVKQDQVKVVGGVVNISGGTLAVDLGKGASRFKPGVDVLAPLFANASGGGVPTNGNFSSIIAPAGYGLSVSNGSLAFAGFKKAVGGVGNVASVASQIDLALRAGVSGASNKLATLIDNADALASLQAATVKANLAALNPAIYAELGNIGIDRLHDVQAGISNHLDMLALTAGEESSLSLGVKPGQSAAPESVMSSARAWTTAYGGWGKRNAESSVGAAGYSSTNYGDVSGVETTVGGFTIGLTGAVGTTSANSSMGSVSTDSWLFGLYGSAPAGPVVFDASVALGQTDSTVKRSVSVAGGGGVSAKTQGTDWTGQFGLAVPVRLDSGSLIVTPSLHVIHASVSTDAMSESSLNGLEAAVKSNKAESTAMRMGVQAAKLSSLGQKPVRLTANLDWIHSFDSERRSADVALTGAGTTTSQFQSSKAGADAIRIGVGAELSITDRVRLRVNVDEQRKSGTNSIYSSASIGVQF